MWGNCIFIGHYKLIVSAKLTSRFHLNLPFFKDGFNQKIGLFPRPSYPPFQPFAIGFYRPLLRGYHLAFKKKKHFSRLASQWRRENEFRRGKTKLFILRGLDEAAPWQGSITPLFYVEMTVLIRLCTPWDLVNPTLPELFLSFSAWRGGGGISKCIHAHVIKLNLTDWACDVSIMTFHDVTMTSKRSHFEFWADRNDSRNGSFNQS